MTLAVPVAPKVSKSVSQYSPAPVVNTSPSKQQNSATAAVSTGFLTCSQHEMQSKVSFGNNPHSLTLCSRGWSNKVEVRPSMMPICEPRPRESSIRKKRADQKGAPGILVNTSAITMKANPVPWAESSSSFTSEQFRRLFSGCSLVK